MIALTAQKNEEEEKSHWLRTHVVQFFFAKTFFFVVVFYSVYSFLLWLLRYLGLRCLFENIYTLNTTSNIRFHFGFVGYANEL